MATEKFPCFAQDDVHKTSLWLNNQQILPKNGTVAGVWYFAQNDASSQVLLLGHPEAGPDRVPSYRLIADLNANESLQIRIPFTELIDCQRISCQVNQSSDQPFNALATISWITPEEQLLMSQENQIETDIANETALLAAATSDSSQTASSTTTETTLPTTDSIAASKSPSQATAADSDDASPAENETLIVDPAQISVTDKSGRAELTLSIPKEIILTITTPDVPVVVELSDFHGVTNQNNVKPISLDPVRAPRSFDPVETSPDFRPVLANALIEWDWQMQDGIETPLEPRTWLQAIEKRLPQGQQLLDDLIENVYEDDQVEGFVKEFQGQWQALTDRFNQLQQDEAAAQNTENNHAVDPVTAAQQALDRNAQAKALWKEMHQLRRKILLSNPLFSTGSLVFTKFVPSAFSHQLTQVYGYCARPGGGLFVLDEPGKSMKTRRLTNDLPMGSFMTPTVSYDGKEIYFAFCEVASTPKLWHDPEHQDLRYHLYKMNADGTNVQQLTQGIWDDFSPTILPNGEILFISTRRGGFHRCGGGPCYVYTLAKMNADGTDPHPISFHETNEWNPAILNDGRIIYTRWDYVDRDAVYYQNLWSTRQDGTDVRIYYGNNTFNPCGIWESRPIPGSSKIMAIAGPHHGMSAGSVILVDNTLGVDGSEPITRLTPEVLYPEGEVQLPYGAPLPALPDFDTQGSGIWMANRPADRETTYSEEQKRWPVHCFKSPWPLSEKYFIASYSYDKLIGEAGPNIPNQFGLYFCDAFGNRELIYRDPNISSLWAMPLSVRPVPPAYLSTLTETSSENADAIQPSTGRFMIQNIYENWPFKIEEKVHSLRVVQVLPKTTPNANSPMVGAANASPGKQILGTVPVHEDGSAFFEAPAKVPMLFQALDEKGRMIQGMRSLVYLQPGETASCTGCHENRMSSVANANWASGSQRIPDQIQPGPDGSRPFSYPILVQPIWDRLCVECHNDQKQEGNVNLSSTPDGSFSKSYQALLPFVSYTAWGLPDGNKEPMTTPDAFGSRVSKLTSILDAGHYDCELTPEDWDRIHSWIDGSNCLFYGTFNVENQKRQQLGERIEGPDLE